MKLKKKTTLMLLIAFTLMTCASTALYLKIVLNDFSNIETTAQQRNIKRFQEAITSERNQSQSTAVDWAQWDGMYDYMSDPDDEFYSNWTTYDAYDGLQVSNVIFFNLEKAPLFSIEVDFRVEEVKVVKETNLFIEQVSEIPELFSFNEDSPVKSMFHEINGELFLLASAPILDSSKTKPTKGTLILAKHVDGSFMRKIVQQVKVQADLVDPANHHSIPPSWTESAIENGFFLTELNEFESIAYVPILGETNRPLSMVKVIFERSIYQQGIKTLEWFLGFFIVACLTTFAVVASLLNKLILTRIQSICETLNEIRLAERFDQRIKVSGSDEISNLGFNINSMLNSLYTSHSKVIEARECADQANAAKSSFIAKVSHELRTPIHSILGMQRIILKESKSASIKHFVRLAQDSTKGLMSTINEILDFSKVASGNLTLEKIPFDIREVARDTMRLMSGRLEAKPDLELLCDIHPDVPVTLEGDPTRLKQIMVNLLGNSIKFTAHGHVKLTIRNSSPRENWDGIIVAISDTGIGIPEEKLGSIFEPFKQADDTVTRNYQGTGLGLAIVKQLCEGMHGTVSVTSTLGKGSVFTAHLGINIVGETAYEVPVSIEPKHVSVIGGAPFWIENLSVGLERFSVSSTVLPQQESGEVHGVAAALLNCGAAIVSSSVLDRGELSNQLIEQIKASGVPLVAILNPSEISLRERLIAAGIKHILTQPLFTDDIFLSLSGKLPLDELSWEDNDEASLQLGKKLRILVADDAPTNRIILENMLKDAGHEVVCVSDGLRMLRKIEDAMSDNPEREHFDIVLTDVQMPLMDGVTATRKIRELEGSNGKNMHIPIIAVTAHGMIEQHNDMRNAGVDGVVTKPIEPSALAEMLEKLTGRAQPQPTPTPASPKPANTATAHTEESINLLADKLWTDIKAGTGTRIVEVDLDLKQRGIAEVLDISDLFNRSGQSARRTAMILRAFKESYQPELDKLLGAGESKDLEVMKKAAHTLKGLLFDIGSKSPGSVAGSIEAHCWAGRPDEGAGLIPTLRNQTLMVAELVEKLTTELK